MVQKVRIPHNWNVPEAITRHIAEIPGTQRALEGDGHLMLILHKMPAPDSIERELRLFWRNTEGEWASTGLGNGIESLRKHIAEYGDHLRALVEAENNATTADTYFQVRREVTPIYRAAKNLSHAMTRAYELAPDDRGLLACRNMAASVERNSELLKDDTTYGIDFHMAKQAENQALASHRLNLIASIFFPILAFSSIFGMNLRHGLEDQQGIPWLFWLFVLIGIGIGLGMQSLVFSSSAHKTSG